MGSIARGGGKGQTPGAVPAFVARPRVAATDKKATQQGLVGLDKGERSFQGRHLRRRQTGHLQFF